MPTPTPDPISISAAVSSLSLLGVLPVITLGAVIFVAGMLYRRFRK